MSVNINIQVPLDVVTAIKAAASSNDGSTQVAAEVPAAINSAVIDAVKALPYEIRASPSLAAPPKSPVTGPFKALGPPLKVSASQAVPAEDEPTTKSTIKIKIMVPGFSVLDVSPDTTLASLRHQLWIPSLTQGSEYVLMHKGRWICTLALSIPGYENGLTLQKLGLKAGDVVDVVKVMK